MRSMTGLGVPAGATMPVQDTAWNPAKPDSAMVGTSGACCERVPLDTASMRMLPARACGNASEIGTNMVGMWPAIRSVMAGAVPR